MTPSGLQQAVAKMRSAGQRNEAIASFQSAYTRLVEGESAFIATAELEPAAGVRRLEELPAADPRILDRVAVIKLNGGLGTSMGLQHAKSLIVARDGRTFLDVIVAQVLALRRRHGVRLPLVLMNSGVTQADTLVALARYEELPVPGLPLDFLQSMIPKLDAETLAPVSWPGAPELEWCPPGHGDVYPALRGSGMLGALIEQGFEVAMISNSDNLGATVDARLATYVAAERLPFLAEVVRGTEADRKGGHIAQRRAGGNLVLRETAQTPSEDQESFRDFRRWQYYNTNTLWIDLRALAETLDRTGGVLDLPLIVNRKTVDPRDKRSTPVIQLESAMGAAIGSFPGAAAVEVPRTRFVPVKTTDDLLVLRSDVYRVGEDERIEPLPERAGRLPYVELDPDIYKLLDGFEARFPGGPPSLREADRLVVRGDITFAPGVVVAGSVELTAAEPRTLEPGAALGG